MHMPRCSVCVYIYIHMYIYIYTHTHTHILHLWNVAIWVCQYTCMFSSTFSFILTFWTRIHEKYSFSLEYCISYLLLHSVLQCKPRQTCSRHWNMTHIRLVNMLCLSHRRDIKFYDDLRLFFISHHSQ